MKKLIISLSLLVLLPFVNILKVNAYEYVDISSKTERVAYNYINAKTIFSSSSVNNNVSTYILDYMETNYSSVDTSYYAFFFGTDYTFDGSFYVLALFSNTDTLYIQPNNTGFDISNNSIIQNGDIYMFFYYPSNNSTSFLTYTPNNKVPYSLGTSTDIYAIFNTNITYLTSVSPSNSQSWDFTINTQYNISIPPNSNGLKYSTNILIPNGLPLAPINPYVDYNKLEFTSEIDSVVFYLKDLQGLPSNTLIQKQFFFNGTFTRFDFALNDFKDIYLTNEDYLINDYLTSILYPNNTISNRDMSVWGIANFDDELVSKLLGVAFDNSTAPYFKKVILTGEDDRTPPMSSLYYIYYSDNLGFITFDKYGAIVSTDSGNTTITIIDDEGTPTDYDLSLFNSISSITLPPKFGMLSSIITLPLQYIGDLTNGTCSALSVPLPNTTASLTLPCGSDIYANFGDIFTLYQTITTGIIAYFVAIKSLALFKEFRDPDSDTLEVVDL